VKTEFCENIPSHLDAIIASDYNEVDLIVSNIEDVRGFSAEEYSDMAVSAGGPALNDSGVDTPSSEEKFFIETAQIYAELIAKSFLGKSEIQRRMPFDSFAFFDGNIYQSSAYKNAKGFYDSFSGRFFLLRQENKLLSCLEIFKQVWMSMGYSWVSCDGPSFLRMNGLAFYGARENLFVFANNALSSQATLMFYHFAKRLPCFGDDANLNVKKIVNGVFTKKESDAMNNVISLICSSYPGRSYVDISNDFYKAQLNGNFSRIRNYCRAILGPNGLKKMGKKTSA
jgi:hypothetical protein